MIRGRYIQVKAHSNFCKWCLPLVIPLVKTNPIRSARKAIFFLGLGSLLSKVNKTLPHAPPTMNKGTELLLQQRKERKMNWPKGQISDHVLIPFPLCFMRYPVTPRGNTGWGWPGFLQLQLLRFWSDSFLCYNITVKNRKITQINTRKHDTYKHQMG